MLCLLQIAGSSCVFLPGHLSAWRETLCLISPIFLFQWDSGNGKFEHWKYPAGPAIWVFGCYKLDMFQPEENGGGRAEDR